MKGYLAKALNKKTRYGISSQVSSSVVSESLYSTASIALWQVEIVAQDVATKTILSNPALGGIATY